MMINLRNQKVDLSHINSLEDIDAEIKILKRRIRQQEADLRDDFKRLPKETLKASLGATIPFFKKATRADKAFSALQTVVGTVIAAIIAGKKSGGGFKKGLSEVLRQLSFWGTARTVMQFFARKQTKKPDKSPRSARPKEPTAPVQSVPKESAGHK